MPAGSCAGPEPKESLHPMDLRRATSKSGEVAHDAERYPRPTR